MIGEEQKISEVSREEIDFINSKSKEYREQGAPDLDAAMMAAEDWKKIQEQESEKGDEMWDNITKDVGLHDFLKDQMIRALSEYKTKFMKSNPDQALDFELKEFVDKGAAGRIDNGTTRLIAGASLRLSFKKNGVWTVWRDKKIGFTHIGEMRQGHKWKLALYEAMYRDVFAWGITYALMAQHMKENPKPAPNGDELPR